jgi:ABC-type uncharacterized transport system permease subunit
MSAAAVLLAAGGAMSLARQQRGNNALRIAAKASAYWGICAALAALLWHALSRQSWTPLGDNFETLAGLGILLAGFTMYVQRARPIAGLDWFMLPIVILMLICAVVFGSIRPGEYRSENAWWLAHVLSSFGGAAAFAVAAALGGIYLVASARLRHKSALIGPPMGSLERLEDLTHTAVRLGFALLTVAMITGLAKIIADGPNTRLGPHWMQSPKVVLAATVWVIYAVALHTPITPGVRGSKSAVLSIAGFVMMFATLIAAQYM